jgi:hypothetical protein
VKPVATTRAGAAPARDARDAPSPSHGAREAFGDALRSAARAHERAAGLPAAAVAEGAADAAEAAPDTGFSRIDHADAPAQEKPRTARRGAERAALAAEGAAPQEARSPAELDALAHLGATARAEPAPQNGPAAHDAAPARRDGGALPVQRRASPQAHAPAAAGDAAAGPRAQATTFTRASAAALAAPRIAAAVRSAPRGPARGGPEAERPREKEREGRDKDVTPRPAPAPTRDAPVAPAPPAEAKPTSAPRSASAAPATPAPLPAAPAGQEVQGAVLRQAAHLRVDAGGLGALELHLRVRDGALHLRVEGDGARAVEARAGELSRALAGEGLKLGGIEAPPPDGGARAQGDGGRGGGERRDAWQEARDAHDAAPSTAAPRPPDPGAPRVERGVHVKA